MKTYRAILLAALVAAPSAACASAPEPEIASPATQAGYAQDYPVAVQSIMDTFNKEDEAARTVDIAIARYPDELKNPTWKQVLEVAQRADEAGRSRVYVERTRETEGAQAFFDDRKDEIGKKLAGSIAYVAKQKGCSPDISNGVGRTLEDAIEKQIEERMREKNEAHRQIERYRAALGAENAAALEKQADAISRASYIVSIELVEEKIRLRALLQEAEQVQKTLDESIATERSFQSESGRTDAEKKAAGDRIATMDKSRGMINATVTSGKDLEGRVEARIQAAQKRHADAMKTLTDALTKRAAGS